MKKQLVAIALFLLPSLGFAAPWKIIPEKSSITFTATQNNAPIQGSFKKFEGEINFDPEKLESSQVNIRVDVSSVDTNYKTVAETLLAPEWFNAKKFPKATFKTTSFKKMQDKEFQAQGILSIRDKKVPIIVDFTLKEYTNNSAVFVGRILLRRLMFGVGQGEWAKTEQVKDQVAVDFTISASR